MLVYDGLLYTLAAIVISLILVVASEPFMGKMIEKMFWFFRFQYTIGPVVLAALIFTVIGAGVPLVVYCVVGKQTIVERLRETELIRITKHFRIKPESMWHKKQFIRILCYSGQM